MHFLLSIEERAKALAINDMLHFIAAFSMSKLGGGGSILCDLGI